MADATVAIGIICVFIIIGGFLPFVRESLTGDPGPQNSAAAIIIGAGELQNAGLLTYLVVGLKVLGSIALMFFWTFGAIWWVLDLAIFVPMRVVLILYFLEVILGT